MTACYYASLLSEKVKKLVLYAPLYDNPLHTNLGASSGLQNKRVPWEFNYGMGAYRLGSAESNNKRLDGEIPVPDKTEYREPAFEDAVKAAPLATLPTVHSLNPPHPPAPNRSAKDWGFQAPN